MWKHNENWNVIQTCGTVGITITCSWPSYLALIISTTKLWGQQESSKGIEGVKYLVLARLRKQATTSASLFCNSINSWSHKPLAGGILKILNKWSTKTLSIRIEIWPIRMKLASMQYWCYRLQCQTALWGRDQSNLGYIINHLYHQPFIPLTTINKKIL